MVCPDSDGRIRTQQGMSGFTELVKSSVQVLWHVLGGSLFARCSVVCDCWWFSESLGCWTTLWTHVSNTNCFQNVNSHKRALVDVFVLESVTLCVRIRPSESGHTLMCPNPSVRIRTYPYVSESVRPNPDIPFRVRICPSPRQYILIMLYYNIILL